MRPKRISSNRVEALVEELKENLYKESTPFTRRIVMVSSPAMKAYLMRVLADHSSLQVIAGVEFCYLEQAAFRLHSILSNGEKKRGIPSKLALSVAVEGMIRKVLASGGSPRGELEELYNYLHKSSSSRSVEKRITPLALHLTSLFTDYAIYGGEWLEKFIEDRSSWQSAFWRELYQQESSPWCSLSDFFREPINPPAQTIHLHLFSLSFVPALYLNYFNQLASFLPLYDYQLVPSREFWSDQTSKKESLYIQSQWNREGASLGEQLSLDQFLFDNNPLLANLGKLGRMMSRQLEELDVEEEERYIVPKGVLNLDPFENYFDEEEWVEEGERGSATLLKCLQGDLLYSRNPSEGEKIDLDRSDRSIQFHRFPNPQQEIKQLYWNIVELISKSQEGESPITPSDVMVMAPNISLYEPFIRSVFSDPEYQLHYQIIDLKLHPNSTLVNGLFKLLDLGEGRWDIASIFKLFEHPFFRAKFRLTLEEVETFKSWVKELQIFWGESGESRKIYLERELGEKQFVIDGDRGTWKGGWSDLISSFIFGKEEGDLIGKVVSSKEFSSSDLVGRCLEIVESLREDLSPISEKKLLLPGEWGTYFEALYDSYFLPDLGDSSQRDHDLLKRSFSRFKELKVLESCRAPLSFDSAKSYLLSILEGEPIGYREGNLQSLKFCSMLPIRAIPAKVICLIGMDETAFPRENRPLSLNEMEGKEGVDRSPKTVDYDRYLFLEALLSVREHLIISYVGESREDRSELDPSVVVLDFMEYLDQSYLIGGEKVTNHLFVDHPFHSFDPSYFLSENSFASFRDYQLAKEIAQRDSSTTPPSFYFDQIEGEEVLWEGELKLELRSLLSAFSNPVRFYMQKRLMLHLYSVDEGKVKSDSPLILSPLEKALLSRQVLSYPSEEIIEGCREAELFPEGVFGELSEKELDESCSMIDSTYRDLDLEGEPVFTVEISLEQREVERISDQLYIVPPISIAVGPNQVVTLYGRIENVTAKGLLTFSRGELGELVKVLPRYLALCSVEGIDSIVSEKNLYLLKSGEVKEPYTDDPIKALQGLVEHYFHLLKAPSLALPEWMKEVVKNDPLALQKKMEGDLSSNQFYNDAVKWSGGELPPSSEIIEREIEVIGNSFGRMIEEWC